MGVEPKIWEKTQIIHFNGVFHYETNIFSEDYPETNSSHLKRDGWKRIVSFSDGLFLGANC